MENISWNTYLWKAWDPQKWKPGLALLTLPWIRPFLAIMGLPKEFIKQPQVWEPIYTQAVKEFHELMQPLLTLGGDEYTQAQMEVTQIVLTKAFQELANQLGKQTSVELERWARRHFLSHEFHVAMFDWKFVLSDGCQYYNNQSSVTPPTVLMPLLPEIEEIIYHGIYGSEYLMKYMTVLPTDEVSEEEKIAINCNWETAPVYDVISQELTMRILNMIAKKLNEQELSEVLNWALLQAEAITVTFPESLKGDKYLKPEPAYFDFPSVLDEPPENFEVILKQIPPPAEDAVFIRDIAEEEFLLQALQIVNNNLAEIECAKAAEKQQPN